MAAPRRGPQAQSSSHYNTLPDLPSISALFLIDFDVKAGYTIIWKQSIPGLELEGVVEYKSLPSGLHTVSEDLIYFVHEDGYAGLSAFVNAPTDEEESRHARMIAVGVLVPLSYGRLGRAWRHADALKDLAAKLAVDRKQTWALDEYWDLCRTRDPNHLPEPIRDSPMASPALGKRALPKGHVRDRSASEGGALMQPGHRLSPFHPAWSLNNLLDTFGPLIFPIQRAALLRKRILISTHTPVNEACNFVYNISVLANIPFSVFDLLDPSAPAQRLRPLFTIGVHDIPFLMADSAQRPGPTPEQPSNPLGSASSGWVACTTDSILAMKDDLWDVLITMPQTQPTNTKEKVWPTVESPKGIPVKATQRDLRRFRTLKAGLRRVAAAAATSTARQPRLSTSSVKTTSFLHNGEDSHTLADAADKIVEPVTWAALAYSGFIWWASAGEQRRSDEAEEAAHDNGLLADLIPGPSPGNPTPQQRRPSGSFNVTGMSGGLGESTTSLTARRATTTADGSASAGGAGAGAGASVDGAEAEEDRARVELGIITYFHRFTATVLGTLAEIVAATDEEEEEEEYNDDYTDLDTSRTQSEVDEDRVAATPTAEVRVDSDALAAMGLDVWSHADAAFVKEIVAMYFDRQARVEGKGVEVCGLRVC
ncbi:hypothetical protein M406DRAFT_86630 [Cryphonectria parasitica EP155]|uniref:DUF4484 domain-containing protein n=1 Tax=Cryphonectria parasitica (strain ATCC 38755 / EP155) TaxID=660469 RepID=A0A9P5CU67_CRYP1|nr:uncharacterized protein M406DRAFT_86630 [Cryphonectria parasitica EP155]KAF3769820.1 hypothetical protein M406DRAFT_86630 [Cryphonectria parasitica EP155]